MVNSSRLYSKVTLEAFQHILKTKLINYIDDTMVHNGAFLDHFDTLREIYYFMDTKKMVCKIKKSHLGYDQMKSLGHIISEYGCSSDPKLVTKLLNIAPPTDITGVHAFLGLLNFNRKYIPNFNSIIGLIQELTCKSELTIEQRWTDAHLEAIDAGKHALTNTPCLLTIDTTKPFVIHTDACKVGRGLGAVLLQQNFKNDWRPVAYYSNKLTEAERGHSATELEAMSFVMYVNTTLVTLPTNRKIRCSSRSPRTSMASNRTCKNKQRTNPPLDTRPTRFPFRHRTQSWQTSFRC